MKHLKRLALLAVVGGGLVCAQATNDALSQSRTNNCGVVTTDTISTPYPSIPTAITVMLDITLFFTPLGWYILMTY